MRILILTLCVSLVITAIRWFFKDILRMLSGRCCGGCRGCAWAEECGATETDAAPPSLRDGSKPG